MDKSLSKKSKTDRKYVNILGINILSTSVSDLLAGIKHNISRSKKFTIYTPNPELILATKKNKELKDVLNNADFNVPDGVGLNYATKILYKSEINIIPGRKLFAMLIDMAVKKNWKVFLLGGLDNETVLAAEHLISVYPLISISTSRGPSLNNFGEPESDNDIEIEKDTITRINEYGPKFLFVAFGNPKQELWINRNLPKLKVNGVMAVGGTFRYIAGLSKLPPKWMENRGLEWLWRLLTEPKRIKRIFNATILFPLAVIMQRLRLGR